MEKKQLRRLCPESLYPHCTTTHRYGMCAPKNNAMKSHPGVRRKREDIENRKGGGGQTERGTRDREEEQKEEGEN